MVVFLQKLSFIYILYPGGNILHFNQCSFLTTQALSHSITVLSQTGCFVKWDQHHELNKWGFFYIHRLVSKDLHAFIAGNVPRPIFPHYISNSDLSDLSVNRWRMVGEVRMSVKALTLCSVWAEKRCMATRTYTNLTFKNVKSAGNINRSESFFKRVARRLCFPGSDYTPIPDSWAATHWCFAGLNANKIFEDERNIYSGLTCT